MIRQRKPWGITDLLYFDTQCQINRILVVKGGYSSRHRHDSKVNVFTILRGSLLVTTYRMTFLCSGKQLVEEEQVLLTPGHSLTVAERVWHRFDALEESEAIECYFAPSGEVSLHDIERFDSNGVSTANSQTSGGAND